MPAHLNLYHLFKSELMSYSDKTRKFLYQSIRQRLKLIDLGRDKKNRMATAEDAMFLKRHLDVNKYNDRQMAVFVLRHCDKISNILPGQGSASHETRKKEFIQIIGMAHCITNDMNQHVFMETRKNAGIRITRPYLDITKKQTS